MKRPTFSDHPGAWRGTDFADKDDFAFDLAADHVAALADAVAGVKAKGHAPTTFTAADFPLGPLADALEDIRSEVLDGRGMVLIRGLPVDDLEDAAHAFWGLGTHLGHAVSQSRMGDRLGHVTDVSGTDPRERGYRSRKELTPHTDADNIVALLCVHGARSGGESQLASALTLHDIIAAEEPAHLAPLFRGFPLHWRGEEPPGEPPITPYRVPVFSLCEGVLSCVYLRPFIDMAAAAGSPLSDLERAALDHFEEVAARDDVRLSFTLEPGEAIVFNNMAMLHSRTAFEDAAPPAPKRHLLRLWLKVPGGRPVVDAVARYYGDDGIVPTGAADTLYEGPAAAPMSGR